LDSRYKRVGFDYETNGTDWAGGSEPIGVAYALEDGRRGYLPFGHRGGGNLDRALVTRWLQTELRGKVLCCAEAKFETHMSRRLGVRLEAMGCSLREAQYKAALLDDTRRSFTVESLASDFLGRHKLELDRKIIWDLPGYVVGPYAEVDAELHLDLDTELTKRIDAEDLTRVSQLEDDLIYATCEMEWNGARLDVPKLEAWRKRIGKMVSDIILKVYKDTGLKINPNSNKDLEKVFTHLNLSFPRTEASENFPEGQGSFPDSFLRRVKHPVIHDIRIVRQFTSLDSKYFKKYQRSLDRNGIIRYKLHQLKGDDYGTIAGRYSSSGYSQQVGCNIQQVYDDERQAENVPDTADMLVRDLFIPDDGYVFGKADASQIEFRFMADFAKAKRLIQAYQEDPWIDQHVIVANVMGVGRKRGKGLNFGMIYAMGRDKLAAQLGVGQEEADKLYDQYNEMFPEVRPLIRQAIEVAKRRGYVKTRLGRKARFDESNMNRVHSSLNRVIQGTAADYLKLKTLEVYRNRKLLGIHKLRWTVHDELDADFESAEHVHGPFAELLNEQLAEIPTAVPILWETAHGSSWAQLTKGPHNYDNKQNVDTRSSTRWKDA
jgi:DNA polymerase-1